METQEELNNAVEALRIEIQTIIDRWQEEYGAIPVLSQSINHELGTALASGSMIQIEELKMVGKKK